RVTGGGRIGLFGLRGCTGGACGALDRVACERLTGVAGGRAESGQTFRLELVVRDRPIEVVVEAIEGLADGLDFVRDSLEGCDEPVHVVRARKAVAVWR